MLATKLKFKYPLVPIEEWIESPYYLGKEAQSVYPFWKQHIIAFFKSDYIKYIAFGSYRTGKTHIARIILMRIIYEISCIENFTALFNLSSLTIIKIAWLSLTVTKAKNTGIKQLLRLIDGSPYFNEHCVRNKNINSYLSFPFLEVIWAADVSHLTGEDLFGVILDEADFLRAKKGEEYSKAKRLYLEAQLRGHATFSFGGRHFGIFGLLSSANLETSFAEREVKAAELGDDPAYVMRAAVYAVRPDSFSPEKKRVFVGYNQIVPHLVEDVTEEIKSQIVNETGLMYDLFLKQRPDLVESVPMDLIPYYRKDIHYALKTLSGRPQKTSGSLVKNINVFKNIFRDNSLQNPLNVEVPTLTLGYDDCFDDYLDPDILIANYEPGANVYVHLDLSRRSDKTGIAFVYKSETTGKIRTLLYTQIFRREFSEEIDASKIESIFYTLMDLGVSFKYVTGDIQFLNYFSQNLKRTLGKERVGYLSVDKDDTQYMTFSFLIKKGVIEAYPYPPFEKEFLELVHDESSHKIDHTDTGSKDVSDALCGAVYNCFVFEGFSREEVVVSDLVNQLTGKDNPYAAILRESSGGLAEYESMVEEAIKSGVESILKESSDPLSSAMQDLERISGGV